MHENRELRKIYAENFTTLVNKLIIENKTLEEKKRATCPLLLKVSEEYLKADIRIMVFGKETHRWYGETINDLDTIINEYDRYNNGWLFRKGGIFFTHGISKLLQKLKTDLPEKKISIIWNNIIKVGEMHRGFPSSINHITQKEFNVIRKEIEVLKPDFLIFYTGPSYDQHIKKMLGNFDLLAIEGFSTRQLSEIKISDLPITSFKTYHPLYLNCNNIDKYLSKISNEIKKRNANKGS